MDRRWVVLGGVGFLFLDFFERDDIFVFGLGGLVFGCRLWYHVEERIIVNYCQGAVLF